MNLNGDNMPNGGPLGFDDTEGKVKWQAAEVRPQLYEYLRRIIKWDMQTEKSEWQINRAE